MVGHAISGAAMSRATTIRASVSAAALQDADAAHQVIAQHLHSDAGGRCLACGELEPCHDRNTAHAALFGHNRQLPRRDPLALIGPKGDFTAGSFNAFSRAQP